MPYESSTSSASPPPSHVFKTLCAKTDDGETVFSLVPADPEVDLKALARLAGKRTRELVPVSQLKKELASFWSHPPNP